MKPSREEQAAQEIGRTEIQGRFAWLMIVTFWTLVLSVPLWQHIHEWSPLASSGRVAPQCYDVLNLLPFPSEEKLEQFETELEDQAVVRQKLLPPTQYVLSRLGSGNENAYCGRDGWLFFRDDVDYVTSRPFLDPQVIRKKGQLHPGWHADPIPALIKMHDDLAEQDIELIVVPTPVKPVIYPEKFSSRYNGGEMLRNASFGDLCQRLESRGVRVLDVAPALMAAKREGDQPLYLNTDTHWTPRGLQIAVDELVGFIRAAGILDAAPDAPDISPDKVEVENQGDIAAMLQLSAGQNLYPRQRVTIQRHTPEPQHDAAPAEILLLGDSFSNIYSSADLGWGEHAGLVEQLQAALNRPIDTMIRNGDGAFATRQQLNRELHRALQRQQAGKPVAGPLTGKRLVIYQFAERELANGNWKVLDFPHVDTPDVESEGPPVTVPSELIVAGRIEAVARVPRPGSVPYRDAITSVHLTDLQVQPGSHPTNNAKEIVAFLWGMRDNLWTPAARYQPGQTINLKLRPWSEVKSKNGRYTRIELDDPDFLLIDLPTYWAEEIP